MIILKNIYRKIIQESWNIGFVDTSIDDLLVGKSIQIEWMKHSYEDRWFADPFVVNVTDADIVLFVEEFCLREAKGRIAALTVDKATKVLKDRITVVEKSDHLSFPQPVCIDDNVYVMPEHIGSQRLGIYDMEGEYIKTFVDKTLTDAVYTDLFDTPRIFSTSMPYPSGKILEIYRLDAERRFCLEDTVIFGDRTARNGGNFFVHQGEVYRPAQICNRLYGEGLCIQRVTYQGGRFIFDDVRRLRPPKGIIGLHTMNMMGDVKVVDGHWIRNNRLSRILFEWRNSEK